MKFGKDGYDWIIYGYNENDSIRVQKFFFNDIYAIENFVLKDQIITQKNVRNIISK